MAAAADRPLASVVDGGGDSGRELARRAAAVSGPGARGSRRRVVAPLTSRHFDFLEALVEGGKLPVDPEAFKSAVGAAEAVLLLGSAPVGPTTVQRLLKHVGRLPTVRFGSTETCLQVMGTPLAAPHADRLGAFERGWAHTWRSASSTGYYIGRAHAPHTEVEVVRSVDPTSPDYFAPVLQGEPGKLVTRGHNVMSGYVGDADATARALHPAAEKDGLPWYVNLGDVVFWLPSAAADDVGADGTAPARDFYWLSRESALLIRGGANYAYEQINAELAAFASKTYGLPPTSLAVAVVGLKLDSEHEDACCVTVELLTAESAKCRAAIQSTFLDLARAAVSKGAKPDKLRIGAIPRNFKGAVLVPQLLKAWQGGGGVLGGAVVWRSFPVAIAEWVQSLVRRVLRILGL